MPDGGRRSGGDGRSAGCVGRDPLGWRPEVRRMQWSLVRRDGQWPVIGVPANVAHEVSHDTRRAPILVVNLVQLARLLDMRAKRRRRAHLGPGRNPENGQLHDRDERERAAHPWRKGAVRSGVLVGATRRHRRTKYEATLSDATSVATATPAGRSRQLAASAADVVCGSLTPRCRSGHVGCVMPHHVASDLSACPRLA